MGKIKKYITPKIEQIIGYCKDKWYRFVVAMVVLVILCTVFCVNLGVGIDKRTVIMLVLCVATSSFVVLPRPKKWYTVLIFVAIFMCIAPGKLFERIELPVHDMGGLMDGAELVNILILIFLYGVLLLVLQNVGTALGVGTILIGIVAILNYYVVSFRGMRLGYEDFVDIKNVVEIISSSAKNIVPELWYSILYFVFFVAWGFWCGKRWNRKIVYHIAISAASVLYIMIFCFFWNKTDYLSKHHLNEYQWHQSSSQLKQGLALSLARDIQEVEKNVSQCEKSWYEEYDVVCHALGVAPEGETVSNAYEALILNYSKGYRVFEVDLSITSDNVVVLRHDWVSELGQAEAFGWETEKEVQTIPDSELFLNTPIYGKYTGMTLLDLYRFMEEHEDVYIILDAKYSNDVREQYSLIVNTALENDLEQVLKRVVVQLYYEEMYEAVESIYSFDNYLYSLYYIGYSEPEQIGAFMEKNNIPVLVMPYTWMNESKIIDMQDYQIEIFVHTVNDINEVVPLIDMGVNGIYTDMILERQVEDIEYNAWQNQ